MEQKFDEFSMKEAMLYAQSDAGQALFAVLQQGHGEKMQKIQQMVTDGDIAGARDAILKLLNTPDAQNVMKNMGGSQHG